MNRKDFFKKLGIGVIGIAIAPKLLAEKTESNELIPVIFTPKRISTHIKVSSELRGVINGKDLYIVANRYKQPCGMNCNDGCLSCTRTDGVLSDEFWKTRIKKSKKWSMEFNGLMK
jgi:hypothetical protein